MFAVTCVIWFYVASKQTSAVQVGDFTFKAIITITFLATFSLVITSLWTKWIVDLDGEGSQTV